MQTDDDATSTPGAGTRRRRRAVGPPGAAPVQPVGDWPGQLPPGEQAPGDEPPDDDARLLADVPPHHGT